MSTTPLTEQQVLETLRQVIDPEINCNIVDLGLVYDVKLAVPKVTVKMTLTTPGCPMHESIAWGVQNALLSLAEVEEVDVELVWDPPWNPAMMTDYARKRLGMA
jgi:metal-sulfur cluster biosynthetic enzyme